ncbi:tryptophan synthase subunit alpha [Candidatus Woesearchaeota archaeon]|nr:tryptophan synthase subunit alpha [Candidatus Woesearchaeota archaeon]
MKLNDVFSNISIKRQVMMAHVYAGDPSMEFTRQLLIVLENRADIIELGIPYADPLADGPVFAEACANALEQGITPNDVFKLAEACMCPVVLTTYYNIIYQKGIAAFVARAKEAGVQGIIVPDLPFEESEQLHETCKQNQLPLIYLITSTTSRERMCCILLKASGFVYVTAYAGVTGSLKKQEQVQQTIAEIRKISSIPIMVGFGIRSREDVDEVVAAGADGCIVGSEIRRQYARGKTSEEGLRNVEQLMNVLCSSAHPK